MEKVSFSVIDDIIPPETWRIKVPREVMRRFLGTDREFLCELRNNYRLFLDCIRAGRPYLASRFVPELTMDERHKIRDIAIGRKDIPIHVELPVRTR